MGLLGKIWKGVKKVLKAPIDMVKKAFKGDPLALVGTLAAAYGGYSLLANSGLTAAGAAAAESTSSTAADTAGSLVSGMAGSSGATGAAMGAVNTATQAANAAIGATGATTASSGGGLLSGIKDWWSGLDSKDKMLAVGTGLKTTGAFIQGSQQADYMKDSLKLKEMSIKGTGTWGNTYKEADKYKRQAKMWFENDPALQKKVNSIQTRLEDPEYRRGFYTLAGLLANPSGQKILQNDPTTQLYS